MKINVKENGLVISSFVNPIEMLDDYENFYRNYLEYSVGSEEMTNFVKANSSKFVPFLHDERMYELWPFLNSQINESGSSNESLSSVVRINNKAFLEKYKNSFLSIIRNTKFKGGEDNNATEMMARLMEEDHDETLSLLNTYFVENYDDERLCVKILTMLNDYSYDCLRPIGQTIALASISNRSSRVKSAAFNLFAHWACPEALKLLSQVEVPIQPWIAMKYTSVKESLEKKCFTQEK